MIPNPHKLGVHKILKHIPLNAMFDAPSKARLRKAVNIADLRLCAKQRAHKVSILYDMWNLQYCAYDMFMIAMFCIHNMFIITQFGTLSSLTYLSLITYNPCCPLQIISYKLDGL